MEPTRYVFALVCFAKCLLFCETTSHDSFSIDAFAKQLNQYCDWLERKGNSAVSDNRQRLHAEKFESDSVYEPAEKLDHSPEERIVFQRLAGVRCDQKFEVLTKEVERESGCCEKISGLTERLERFERRHKEKPFIRDCRDAVLTEAKVRGPTGGVFDIYPDDSGIPMEIYCDLTTDGGGWTVFQRRKDGSENFERDFADYIVGFGRKDREFWLGLDKLQTLTKNRAFELRVDLTDWDDNKAYASYTNFSIEGASSQYTLRVSGYSGTAGDSLAVHNGKKFYARDRDNKKFCSRNLRGGWWYGNCHRANLNGIYMKGGKYEAATGYGVTWIHWKGWWYSAKYVEMKIRSK